MDITEQSEKGILGELIRDISSKIWSNASNSQYTEKPQWLIKTTEDFIRQLNEECFKRDVRIYPLIDTGYSIVGYIEGEFVKEGMGFATPEPHKMLAKALHFYINKIIHQSGDCDLADVLEIKTIPTRFMSEKNFKLHLFVYPDKYSEQVETIMEAYSKNAEKQQRKNFFS